MKTMLKSIDFYVLVALLALPRRGAWTQACFAYQIGLAQPALTRSLQRLAHADLWNRKERRVDIPGAEGLLVHAARFLIPPQLGQATRGFPTAHSAPPLASMILANSTIVWPDDEGGHMGTALEPLHPSAPGAARANPRLHELLALVDALRVGRARERTLAVRLLHDRLVEDS